MSVVPRKRSARLKCSDRDIARAVLMALADSPGDDFSPTGFYDDDADTIESILEELKKIVPGIEVKGVTGAYLHDRLLRVCNQLDNWRILIGTVRQNPDHQYIGEPTRWKDFRLAKSEYAYRLKPELYPHYTPMGTPEFEMNFLLRNAYPDPNDKD